MDRYCSSTFWDPMVTWNTTDPDFTECFEKTVLLWSACGVFWITAIFDIFMLSDPNRGSSFIGHGLASWSPGWTYFTVGKLVIICLLTFLEIAVLVINLYDYSHSDDYQKGIKMFTMPDVLWTTPLVLITTHGLSASLILLHKTRCVHTSGFQLLHWSLLTIVHGIIFRTEYKIYYSSTPSIPSISYSSLILLGISAGLMFLQSIIFCWSDIPSGRRGHRRLIECSDGIEREECPMIRCSCLSYIFYSWCTPFIRKGYKQPLTPKDLWNLIPSLASPLVFRIFKKSYGKPVFGETRSIFRNIIKPIMATSGWSFAVGLICKQISCVLTFLAPKLMGFLIDFVEDSEMETWKGYMWAFLLLFIYAVNSITWELFYLLELKCYANVLTCLNLLIYKKSMRVSSNARKKTTTGEVVNLMSIDVEAIRFLVWRADEVFTAPLNITLGIVLIWNELSYAVFPGVGLLLILIPINWLITAKMSKYQRAQMEKKDERIKVIGEVLSGIQAVKLYAWEGSFLKQISGIRREEVGVLRKRAVANGLLYFVLVSVPFLVSILSFFTYIYISGGVLEPKKAFTALVLFNLLTDPIQDFPSAISMLVDARVSFKRINDFLNAEENHPEAVRFLQKSEEEPAVEIKGGSFAWEEIAGAHWKLEDINLEVKPASLTAIIGKVGSGKSSLLSAMLGDMKHCGEVIIRGKVAWVPQSAFILNGSLRENICFGLPYHKQKYDEVVECCCLIPDMEILPAGDMTEIGEKGINLSGGQKQRVSLARAVYSEADIFLLDDVLSAVDAHVGKHIFDRLLGPSGILNGKTRILCTHAYQYLSQVDCIVVVDDGRIIESGNYDELIHNSGKFKSLVSSHIQSKEELNGTGTSSAEEGKRSTADGKMDADITKLAKGKLIQEESVETGDVKLSVFEEYFKALGYPLTLAFIVLFGGAEALLLGQNIVLSKWTTAVDYSKNSTNAGTTMYTIQYTILGLSQSVCYLFGYLVLLIAALRATQLLHNKMLNRILHAPMSFFNTTPVGRVINRFSTDIDCLDKYIPYNIGDWFTHIFKVFGVMTAIIYSTNAYFIVYMVPITIIYYFLQRHYILCMQQLERIYQVLRSPIYSQFQESLNGTSTIRAFKAEERFSRMLGDKIDNFNRALFPNIIVRRWLSVRLGLIASTVVFVPALFAVVWRETANPSLVGLSISYALQLSAIISWLIKVTSYIQYNFVSVERIMEYSAVEQEADFHGGKKSCSEKWPENGAIRFDGYETRYRAGLDLVLKRVTCEITPGEKIGIVGRTGTGKSSLTLAIFRIIEAAKGEIRIDGVNIAELGLHQVRKRLTVIPQDPVLFSRSLRLNLDPFEEHGDDKVWKALEMAHLKDYVKGLEEGLDYPVAEGGANLSQGQRQLVCLARAILRKSTILILDEATASVDRVTDDLIQKTIREQFGDCTILNVAHRLNTVMDSSRILVLERGEIVEFDTPQNLLANSDSQFYGMAKDAGIV